MKKRKSKSNRDSITPRKLAGAALGLYGVGLGITALSRSSKVRRSISRSLVSNAVGSTFRGTATTLGLLAGGLYLANRFGGNSKTVSKKPNKTLLSKQEKSKRISVGLKKSAKFRNRKFKKR